MKVYKILKSLILCATLILLSSCVTKFLWGYKKYDEKILQAYVGSDGRYVVFVAQEYHYIFTDNSGLLKEVLGLKTQNILTINPEKTYLKLDANNDIKGHIVIEGPFDILAQEDMIKLGTLGVRPNRDDNVSIKINLVGRRYAARYLGAQAASNSAVYKIPIYYNDDNSFAKSVGRVAVTPVAVTLDAVLLIGKVVIYPLKMTY